MKKGKKKQIVIRVTRLAPKRYMIEQKRRLLWLWEFWQQGSPTLGLRKFYSSRLTAKTAIQCRADKAGRRAIIIFR